MCRCAQLLDLCAELRFAILSHVQDVSALCYAGASCVALRDLAYDDLLWARHYEAHFGAEAAPSPSSAPVFVAFRRAYAQAKRAAQEAERQAEAGARAHAFRMPGGLMPGGFMPGLPGGAGGGLMPPGVPQGIGMLGGDYDRLPSFSVPSPFGPSPFGGGSGVGMMPPGMPAGPGDGHLPYGSIPPGARFDPISPLIDQVACPRRLLAPAACFVRGGAEGEGRAGRGVRARRAVPSIA